MGEDKNLSLMKKRAVKACCKLLGCRTLGGGVFFSYAATQHSASQQSTLRKLDRVKEFLWEKSQTMTTFTFRCIQTVIGGCLIMSATCANTELRPKAN